MTTACTFSPYSRPSATTSSLEACWTQANQQTLLARRLVITVGELVTFTLVESDEARSIDGTRSSTLDVHRYAEDAWIARGRKHGFEPSRSKLEDSKSTTQELNTELLKPIQKIPRKRQGNTCGGASICKHSRRRMQCKDC